MALIDFSPTPRRIAPTVPNSLWRSKIHLFRFTIKKLQGENNTGQITPSYQNCKKNRHKNGTFKERALFSTTSQLIKEPTLQTSNCRYKDCVANPPRFQSDAAQRREPTPSTCQLANLFFLSFYLTFNRISFKKAQNPFPNLGVRLISM